MSSKQVILAFYRALQHSLRTSSLDRQTKSRIKTCLRSKFCERPSTEHPLYERLQDGRELQDLLSKNTDYAVSQILQKVYIDAKPLQTRLPSWLYRFLSAPTIGRRNRVEFYNDYGPLIQITHSIEMFRKKNPEIVKRYYDQLAINLDESMPTGITGILEGNADVDPKQRALRDPENVKGSRDSDLPKLLTKLKTELGAKADSKLKFPSFKMVFNPNRFGQPIVKARMFNDVIRRLVKIQEYFRRYNPIYSGDLEYLDKLEESGFYSKNPTVKGGYKRFIKSCLAIKDDGTVVLSDSTYHMSPPSDYVLRLYAESKPSTPQTQ